MPRRPGHPARRSHPSKSGAARAQQQQLGIRSAMYGRVFNIALVLVGAVVTALIYLIGGRLVVSGAITIGTLVALDAHAVSSSAVSNAQTDRVPTRRYLGRIVFGGGRAVASRVDQRAGRRPAQRAVLVAVVLLTLIVLGREAVTLAGDVRATTSSRQVQVASTIIDIYRCVQRKVNEIAPVMTFVDPGDPRNPDPPLWSHQVIAFGFPRVPFTYNSSLAKQSISVVWSPGPDSCAGADVVVTPR